MIMCVLASRPEMTSMHALQLRDEIFDGGDIQETFLAVKSVSQQAMFVALLSRKIKNTPECSSLFSQQCESGHKFTSFIPTIAAKFFNCMSKTFVRKINDEIHVAKKRDVTEKGDPAARKIRKLQSD